jgi:hypothetical protein
MKHFRSTMLLSALLLGFGSLTTGCAVRGTVTHKVTVAQHSLLSVVGAFDDAESAEFAKGFVPADLHVKMQTGVQKVALAAKDLDSALIAGAAAPNIKTKLDAIYTLLDSLNSDGISGIKNATTKATLELALDAIKAIIDNALVQVGG